MANGKANTNTAVAYKPEVLIPALERPDRKRLVVVSCEILAAAVQTAS